MTQQTIVNVVGARPNFMKIAPIHRQMLKHPDLRPILVHTGQHYDQKMSQTFFDELNMPEPDQYLGVGSGSHAEQTGAIMLALERLFAEIKPDQLVVVGDVNSTLAAALVAAKMHIPIAHVEAGLRSFDRTMPEEINRILTDAIADQLFVTEQSGLDHLAHEGVAAEKIFFVGNVMIDSLVEHLAKAKTYPILEELGIKSGKYALMTLHRPSNVDNPEMLDTILSALEVLQVEQPIVFPIHPRTEKMISSFGLDERIKSMKNLIIVPPLGYMSFLRLTCEAAYVITDSGGIQEETTFLDIPCLTLRENTERPVTVTLGTNRLVPLQTQAIIEHARLAVKGDFRRTSIPPLWDGHSSERIVEILRH
jgi:UDP-N-acetylglucosamine 2-epimerase (non-hydrolysing)